MLRLGIGRLARPTERMRYERMTKVIRDFGLEVWRWRERYRWDSMWPTIGGSNAAPVKRFRIHARDCGKLKNTRRDSRCDRWLWLVEDYVCVCLLRECDYTMTFASD